MLCFNIHSGSMYAEGARHTLEFGSLMSCIRRSAKTAAGHTAIITLQEGDEASWLADVDEARSQPGVSAWKRSVGGRGITAPDGFAALCGGDVQPWQVLSAAAGTLATLRALL